jgi:hypothetical protein
VKIQGSSQILGQPVFAADGRRAGTVTRLRRRSDDPYTVTWVLIRLRGPLRRLRAVPAVDAAALPYRGVRVPYGYQEIVASPPATDVDLGDSSWRRRAAAHYKIGCVS